MWKPVLVALVAFIGLACHEAPRTDAPDALSFRVDERLLGPVERFRDLGISLQPPMDWPAVPSDSLRGAAQTFLETDALSGSATSLRILQAFRSGDDGSMLLVSGVTLDEDQHADSVIAALGRRLAVQDTVGRVRKGVFSANGLRFTQFLIQPPGRVVFKLLVEGAAGQVAQLDYILPARTYPERLRAVESSIGTVRRVE